MELVGMLAKCANALSILSCGLKDVLPRVVCCCDAWIRKSGGITATQPIQNGIFETFETGDARTRWSDTEWMGWQTLTSLNLRSRFNLLYVLYCQYTVLTVLDGIVSVKVVSK